MPGPQGEEQLLAEFDKCPVCGCVDRLMEMLLKEEIERGTVDKNTTPCLLMMGSVAANPNSKILIGQMVNVGTAVTDVCLGCGTIYATKIYRGKAMAQMPAPASDIPIVMPKPN